MTSKFPIIDGTWQEPNPSKGGVGFSCYGGYDKIFGSNSSWRAPIQSDDGWGNLNASSFNIEDSTVINHFRSGWYCTTWNQQIGKILPFGKIHCESPQRKYFYEGALLGVNNIESNGLENEVFISTKYWYCWTTKGLIAIDDNEFKCIQPIGYNGIYDNYKMAFEMVLNFQNDSNENILEILNALYRKPLLSGLESIAREFGNSETPLSDWMKSKEYNSIGVDALSNVLDFCKIKDYLDCLYGE